MAETQRWQAIPTQLELAEFEQFVLPHLSIGSRGPAPKLSPGWRGPPGNALHADLPHLEAMGGRQLHERHLRRLSAEAS